MLNVFMVGCPRVTLAHVTGRVYAASSPRIVDYAPSDRYEVGSKVHTPRITLYTTKTERS